MLLLSDTTVVLVAALFNDTVHVVDALLPSVDGVHDRDVSCAGAMAVSVKLWELPFRLAVSSAVWSELTPATVAENVPVV